MNRETFKVNKTSEKGAAVLITSLILLSVAVIFIPTFVFLVQTNQDVVQNRLKVAAALNAAEAAVEDSIYRIKKGLRYSEENSLTLGQAVVAIKIETNGSKKTISVESQAADRHRKIEAVLAIEGTIAEFHYGLQIGEGGLVMENASKVKGSIYSNSNIVGYNEPEITGDAFAAASSSISGMKIGGSARANSIVNSRIAGDVTMVDLMDNSSSSANVYAANITNSNIAGNATFINIDDKTYVGGQRISTTTAPEPLALRPFPISEAQLDQWEKEAEAGGIINSPCPEGVYTVTSAVSLGPAKINCNLRVRTDKGKLTLNGPVWVKGDILVENNGIIKLSGYFGENSSFIIADDPENRQNKGVILIRQGGQFQGSGTSGSYLLGISRNNSAASGGSVVAISAGNSSVSGIFYAPQGLIEIQNEINVKGATAYKLLMKNESSVTYESGLADLLFTSGPTAGWNLVDWQEKL